MKLRDLPMTLVRFELAKARLKIAELVARQAETEIYESICQNLIMVHFRLSTSQAVPGQGVDLVEMSETILQSVRDLRKLSSKSFNHTIIETEKQFLDLLDRANTILALGVETFKVEDNLQQLRSPDFLYLFLILHNLLVRISAQKRSIQSILFHGSLKEVICIINYSGLPINIGRLTGGGNRGSSTIPIDDFSSLKLFSVKLSSAKSTPGRKCIQLSIPLFSTHIDS